MNTQWNLIAQLITKAKTVRRPRSIERVYVHSADISDREGAKLVIARKP